MKKIIKIIEESLDSSSKQFYKSKIVLTNITIPKSQWGRVLLHEKKLLKNDYVFIKRNHKPTLLLCHGSHDGKVYLNGKKYTLEELSKVFPRYKKLNIICCWGGYIEPYITDKKEFIPCKITEPVTTKFCYINKKGCIIVQSLTYTVAQNIIKGKPPFDNIETQL